jgi:hypothetical protein
VEEAASRCDHDLLNVSGPFPWILYFLSQLEIQQLPYFFGKRSESLRKSNLTFAFLIGFFLN